MKKIEKDGSLKDFKVICKLGEGAFSQVYKVKRNSDDKEYAMKKVKIQSMSMKEKQNALNEVRILASIHNDYIIGYKEAFIDQQDLCIIMEYCPKGDIASHITENTKKGKKFEEKEIWKALVHMLRGLQCLHQMNILHRDMKCANVFINKEGLYQIGDLNVSKIAKQGLVYTQTGTPYYAAPEVWRDKPYDLKCDIWSLGCIIYEMASLKPPFQAQSLQALSNKIRQGVFERIPFKYSSDLQQVIQLCLKVQASARPNTDQLIKNPLVLKNANLDDFQEPINNNQFLLDTIQCPKNYGPLINVKFPQSKYNIQKNNSYIENPIKTIEEEKEMSPVTGSIRSRVQSAHNQNIKIQQIQNHQPQYKPPLIQKIKSENHQQNLPSINNKNKDRPISYHMPQKENRNSNRPNSSYDLSPQKQKLNEKLHNRQQILLGQQNQAPSNQQYYQYSRKQSYNYNPQPSNINRYY